MAKLSKIDTKKHLEACALLIQGATTRLSLPEREYVLDHWNPAAEHNIAIGAAHFTPASIAQAMMIETLTNPGKTLDLCAGIGRLAHEYLEWHSTSRRNITMTCLEINPRFCEVGRICVPDATWICGSMLNSAVMDGLGAFDEVISNPPYGTSKEMPAGKYNAGLLQLYAAQMAIQKAPTATFILNQGDLPFSYSGRQGYYQTRENTVYNRFSAASGIDFRMNCGIDTSSLEDSAFRYAGVAVEIVIVEPSDVQPVEAQPSLF